MCRVLIYLGKEKVNLSDLLLTPNNSLICQTYAPKLMRAIQNLAGFGMASWDYESNRSKDPFVYRSQYLPFFDKNLVNIAKAINTNCLLAHVRGVEYNHMETVTRENVHPFIYPNYTLALAHNGSVVHMDIMKTYLLNYIKPEVAKHIRGTTDSEWIYALFMSQFVDPTASIELDEAYEGLYNTLKIIRNIRNKVNINVASPVNLFVSNGNYILITRFVYDFGRGISNVKRAFVEYHSLWFTFGEHYRCDAGFCKMYGAGKRQNVIFASEPLTEDRTTWIEIPEYSITKAWFKEDEIKFTTHDINI